MEPHGGVISEILLHPLCPAGLGICFLLCSEAADISLSALGWLFPPAAAPAAASSPLCFVGLAAAADFFMSRNTEFRKEVVVSYVSLPLPFFCDLFPSALFGATLSFFWGGCRIFFAPPYCITIGTGGWENHTVTGEVVDDCLV
eukprot:SAG31_NODE_20687_length_567_cov_8.668803_1_plen_144_part_00